MERDENLVFALRIRRPRVGHKANSRSANTQGRLAADTKRWNATGAVWPDHFHANGAAGRIPNLQKILRAVALRRYPIYVLACFCRDQASGVTASLPSVSRRHDDKSAR